jgi:DNA-binding IclR family transcriptional regulator
MKSTIKVFRVLEFLCEGKAAGVSELGAQLGIKPSSVHRFLSVLVDLGYVEKNSETGKYVATLKVFQLGVSVRNKMSLISVARPFMKSLCESLHETVNIAIFTGQHVVVIDRVKSAETLRANIVVGQRLPAYCTAFGKTFLAAMSHKELDRYLAAQPLEPMTRQTHVDRAALVADLSRIRRDGFAIDNRELDENVRCIAGPIRDESGDVVAALSVSGPVARLKMTRLNTFKRTIIDTTGEISLILGYQADFPGRWVSA